ncbi:Hint domain-containing protein [Donghicola sp. XS_ASV15]|uniref:Hint domain-containing protein n=1 Tax=Donghicola sp. XS_ASV15 TaxID=3241295 RepID=UPI00351418C2
MATTFEVLYLGNLSLIDTDTNDEIAENAAGILGSYGSEGAPLYDEISTFEKLNTKQDADDTYDVDNGGGYDTFEVSRNGTPKEVRQFDAIARYNITLTYIDGTTATITAYVFQDTTGDTYLAPDTNYTTNQALMEAKPIQSLSLDSVASNTGDSDGDMAENRYASNFATPVDGTAGNDSMPVGYTDSEGDRITNGNDFIYGHGGNDTIDGGDGNDFISGGTGDDSIIGGSGNDSIQGNDGSDYIDSGVGTDTIDGGAGNDTIIYGTGQDVVYGGAGDDYIDDGAGVQLDGANTVYGGDGADRIYTGNDNDVVYGEQGADNIWGEWGNDTIDGGTENDTISGGEGADSLIGGAGNDEIWGGNDNDVIYGDDGADFLSGDAGDDTIWFGSGDDTVYGGDGNDSIDDRPGDGLVGDNYIDGGTGNDTVWAGYGSDTVVGGTGDDSLHGDQGDDTLEGGEGVDVLWGDAGNDVLDGGAGNDHIVVGDGYDTVVASSGTDNIYLFDLNDDDADGRTNTQIDVSNLTDSEGNPVRWDDVTVTDDGSGNAVLTFPNGEQMILQGVAPATVNSQTALISMGVPCFTVGTMILTPVGEVPIETLRPGDLVVTRDNGPQPLIWSGARHLNSLELETHPELRPVRIAPGDWAGPRGLLVSPQHGIYAHGGARGGTDQLIRATHMARLKGGKVRIAHGVSSVTYVHLMFSEHQVIFGNGIASESFYPGKWGLSGLAPACRREILHLFPDLKLMEAPQAYGTTAMPFARFKELPQSLYDLSLNTFDKERNRRRA